MPTLATDSAPVSAPASQVSDGHESKSIIDALPHWLRPGVALRTHMLLQGILFALNAFLGYCAIAGVFRPHFEIMFVLSLGLTGCYFFFMHEIAKIHAEELKNNSEPRSGGESKKEN